MRKLLRVASFLFYPVPYPYAGGYHFLVGSTLLWWLKYGAPASYTFGKVLAGGGIGLVAGALGCIVFGYLLARAEEKEAN
ncbi:hypothetical protein [Hymenobacter metallilatus]|uniref:Uncharacterized protein n=1 Tax=Hymenobacter metallilatus TaxID=2493666 RepID=A0A3R9M1L5_9BACT|nr:hypothetical protein [Hymenobacter metallilatus]RSK33943.1 hypothetical protein EI290_09565 [Hymenobacter metallilatus]